jgi:hypothetical protein
MVKASPGTQKRELARAVSKRLAGRPEAWLSGASEVLKVPPPLAP